VYVALGLLLPMVAVAIGAFQNDNGNVIAGQTNIGKALGLGMVIIIAVVMIIYVLTRGGRPNGCDNWRGAGAGRGGPETSATLRTARLVPGVALGDPDRRRHLLPAPALLGVQVRRFQVLRPGNQPG
jgi:hypothetical protein